MVSLTIQQPSRPQRVRLIIFPGGYNWPDMGRAGAGLSRRERIDLEVTPTPGSVFSSPA